MNKKWAVWLVAIIMMISVGTLLIVPTMTKNQGSELAMAVDNLNPFVKVQTVYGRTNQAIDWSDGRRYLYLPNADQRCAR